MSYSSCIFTSEKELALLSKWYAMWINPVSIDITWNHNSSEILTKKGFEFLHWQPSLAELSFSGVSGWLNSGKTAASLASFKTENDSIDGVLDLTRENSELLKRTTPTIETESNARLYMFRLQKIAMQEKFFYDLEVGYRRYNNKQLVLFTKNYPKGLYLSGVFEDFSIKETAQDSQLIPYEAKFRVQKGLPRDFDEEVDNILGFKEIDLFSAIRR